ncbi:MAG: orc1/cdc6 family replication initiation protein [Nanoarchaeota archaeon]
MINSEIEQIFDGFDKNTIFKDKSFLQSNHKPDEILHRKDQIKQIASILAPVLRGEKTSNLFLYGKTGSGKTLSVQYVQEQLSKRAKENNKYKLKIEYLNCRLKKISDTEYRILAELIKKMGGSVPDTGLPTQTVYSKFIEIIDSEKQLIVLILDEIDQTVKKISSDFLYNLTRINSELSKSQICIVGISNDLTFLDQIDPRVKSSLSQEEIVFPPYNALQLKDILNHRARLAFKEGIIEEGVIEKCAAFAAREHGDARRALDLLRIAGELTERDNSKKIKLKYIDDANEKIEKDKILDIISTEPKQFQLVLYSIIKLSEQKNKNGKGQLQLTKGITSHKESIFTGDVYNYYEELCLKNKMEVLTQRRVSDIIQEFDMLGIINVKVISKGRGGRMREIKLSITKSITEKAKEIIHGTLNYI